jgi:hypothetical protein
VKNQAKTRTPIRFALRGLGVLLALFAVAGCSTNSADSTSPQSENGFVGSVDGTDAFVSLVVGEDKAAAYVCNGDEQIAEYFWGSVDDSSSFTLESTEGATITAGFEDGTFSGQVTLPDGSTYKFETTEASQEAGIYLVAGENAVTAGVAGGWVVDGDNNERGALRRGSRFQRTPKFNRSGVKQAGAEIAVVKLSVSGGKVTASDASGTVFSIPAPSPAGPIPIPLPNVGKAKKKA